ncbi:MAG TPA: ectoine hydroxylase [Acidimicrobiia bacterium]|nr:ectoine hydroxylase [Acidimicrobiia bacterium]
MTVTDHYPTRVSEEASIVDRKEPVVRGSEGDGPLSRAQLDAFDRDGFLLLENVFTAGEVDDILSELARLAALDEVKADDRTITEPESDAVRSIFEVHRIHDRFAGLAGDERVAGAARQIVGSDVYVHQSRVNFKPGFRGKEFSWHSDFETWHAEDGMPAMRAVSASIALTDNHVFNGPLMIIPGSHRRFVACVGETPEDHYKASLKAQELGVPDDQSLARLVEEAGGEIATLTGKAGSVVLFDCNAMHGSNSNITPYPRSNVFLVYNSVENRLVEPFAAPKQRPSFIAAREFTPV